MTDVYRLDGIFYGMLGKEDQAVIDAMIKAGLAYLSYEGVAGFLGLGKVRFRDD